MSYNCINKLEHQIIQSLNVNFLNTREMSSVGCGPLCDNNALAFITRDEKASQKKNFYTVVILNLWALFPYIIRIMLCRCHDKLMSKNKISDTMR